MRLRFALAAWSNPHFDNALYPLGTPHAEHLPRYASLFDAVEADVLHHRMPSQSLLQDWISQTPEGFLFLPKMHKDATHGPAMRGGGRLAKRHPWLNPQLPQDPAAEKAQQGIDQGIAKRFMEAIETLRAAKRLGPVLLQFAPSLTREAGWDRLTTLLSAAPPGTFAVELRHTSWFVPAAEELLEDFEAPLVWSTYPGAFAPPWRTSDRGYVRFTGKHMPKRGRHVTVADRTSDVREVARRLKDASWKECFVVVSNPFEGNAVDTLPKVAEHFGAEKLAQRLKRPPGGALFPDPPTVGGLRQARLG